MNNKGQTLVIFIIMMPIILLIFTLVIDLGYVSKEKIKIDSTLRVIIRNVLEKETFSKEMVDDLIEKNELTYDNYKYSYENGLLKINITKNIKSILGKIINTDIYKIEIKLTGYIENDKIIIEKG